MVSSVNNSVLIKKPTVNVRERKGMNLFEAIALSPGPHHLLPCPVESVCLASPSTLRFTSQPAALLCRKLPVLPCKVEANAGNMGCCSTRVAMKGTWRERGVEMGWGRQYGNQMGWGTGWTEGRETCHNQLTLTNLLKRL